MWIRALMSDGGGPSADPGAGDAGGGSSGAGPAVPRASSGNPRIDFPEPDAGEGGAPQRPGGQQTPAAAPFYKRGDRAFKDQAELDRYMEEQEREAARYRDFDPRTFQDQILQEVERRYVMPEDEPRGGSRGQGQGQGGRGQSAEEFTPQENPFDKETQPAEWAEHTVQQATQRLEHTYNQKFEALEEQLGGLMSAHEQSQLRSEYRSNFAAAFKDPRVARDVEPGMEELLEHVVGIDPRTKNDFSNVPQQVSAWGRRFKSWADARAARMADQQRTNGARPVPSATRGAAAPVTRRPDQPIENPGSLDGKNSAFNRLRHRFASGQQE